MEKIEVSKEFLRNLAQHAADTSAMFMPMSGFAMIGPMMAAKAAGEILGEEIKPNERSFLGTVKMVEAIKAPYTEELEKLGKEVEDLRHKIWEQPIVDKISLSKAIAFLKRDIEANELIMNEVHAPEEVKQEAEEEYYYLTQAVDVIETVMEKIA